MFAYGEKDGKKYTDVFGGAKDYSTEITAAYRIGLSHSFSTSESSFMPTSYGTQTTSFSLGKGWDLGVARTYTVDITRQINNAPSAIAEWFRTNVRHTPQFD